MLALNTTDPGMARVFQPVDVITPGLVCASRSPMEFVLHEFV